jgi:hypothetical protein
MFGSDFRRRKVALWLDHSSMKSTGISGRIRPKSSTRSVICSAVVSLRVAFFQVMTRLDVTEEHERRLHRWAAELAESVQRVLAVYPEADPDNVRHTLLMLELAPIERLRRSLLRGRFAPQRKSRNSSQTTTAKDNNPHEMVALISGADSQFSSFSNKQWNH